MDFTHPISCNDPFFHGPGARPGPWNGGSPIRWKPWDGRPPWMARWWKKPTESTKNSGQIWEIYGKYMGNIWVFYDFNIWKTDEHGRKWSMYGWFTIYIYIYLPKKYDFLWLCWISIREFFSKLHGMISYVSRRRKESFAIMAAMGVLSENPVLQQ